MRPASRSTPRRLLVVTDTLSGGLGAVARRHVSWFADREWSVALAGPDDGPAPDPASPVRFHQVPTPPTIRHAGQSLRTARALARVRATERPDIVHVHGLRSAALATAAGIRRPFVTLHGIGPVPSDPPLHNLVRRAGIAAVPLFAEASSAEPGWGRGWRHLIFASPFLEDLDRLPFPAQDTVPTVAWVGLLDQRKQPEVFVRAIARVAATRPIRGVIAGEGPRAAEIAALVATTGAPVELLGQTDPIPLLAGAWVVALFSRTEAMPMALQEGMWAGRPIVGSRLPGIALLAGNRDHLADTVDEAAAAIGALCDHATAVAAGDAAAIRIRTLLRPGSPWPQLEEAYCNR